MAGPAKNNYGDTKSLVNVEAIEQNTVILTTGDLRQVIMVGGVNFALKSPAEQDALVATYQNFLNSLEYSVQIIIHSRKINIEDYLKNLEGFETNEPSVILKNQISEYREFVRQFVEKNAIMQKSFFIVVPYTSITTAMKQTGVSFFTSLNPFGRKTSATKTEVKEEGTEIAPKTDTKEVQSKVSTEDLAQGIVQLSQRTSQIIDGLFAIGLDAVQLGNEQLIELFYNFYNPESTEKQKLSLSKT